jgi:hypothetical protein
VINFGKATKYISIALIALMLSTFNIQINNLNTAFGSNLLNNINYSIGQTANATPSTNFDNLYNGAVIMLRNAHSSKLLNIAEGPVGPHVVWSPETAEQNHDNTIVVIKKEGVNIVELMNRHTRKVLGVSKSGLSESKLEVQTPTFAFNEFQSFYVDYLPNGNIYFTSVAHPSKIITLPYGGTRNDFTHFILYDKAGVSESKQSQFLVDMQGDGASTTFGSEPEVVVDPPTPEVTYEEPVAEQPQVSQQPTPVQVTNQVDKLRTGAVVVLRNADLIQAVNIRNLPNGSKVNGSPANAPVDDEMILVVVQKPNSNIYQFFNRKNGKVLSVSTKGQVGDWAEVWNRVPGFNPYQSFYIDTLPNGNMVLSPVAFPSLALNLPEGGRSTTYQHYTLWSKEDIGNGLNRQFRVDVLDYGADTSLRAVPTVNTPTTVTQFQSNNGTVKLVNNNPVGVVGTNTNSGNFDDLYDGAKEFNYTLSESFRKDKILMNYYSALPKVQMVQTIGNSCPEIRRGEFSDNSGAFWIKHLNACGKVYTYYNRIALNDLKAYAQTVAGGYVGVTGLAAYYTVGIAVPPTLYAAFVYTKLAADAESCINKGAKSAWFEEYGYPSVQLTCSY